MTKHKKGKLIYKGDMFPEKNMLYKGNMLWLEIGECVVVEWPGKDFEIVRVTEKKNGIDVYFNVGNVVGCEYVANFVEIGLPLSGLTAVQKSLLGYVNLEILDHALLRFLEGDSDDTDATLHAQGRQ